MATNCGDGGWKFLEYFSTFQIMHVPITSRSRTLRSSFFFFSSIQFFHCAFSDIFNCVRVVNNNDDLLIHTNRGITQNTFFKPFSPLLFTLLSLPYVWLARASRCVHINVVFLSSQLSQKYKKTKEKRCWTFKAVFQYSILFFCCLLLCEE